MRSVSFLVAEQRYECVWVGVWSFLAQGKRLVIQSMHAQFHDCIVTPVDSLIDLRFGIAANVRAFQRPLQAALEASSRYHDLLGSLRVENISWMMLPWEARI